MKTAFNAQLEERNLSSTVIWEQVKDCIVSTVSTQEHRLVAAVKYFRSKLNFFELVRFDFMVDSELNVHLLEINMSPSLFPRENTKVYHEPMYAQMLFDSLNLVGIGSYFERKSSKQL